MKKKRMLLIGVYGMELVECGGAMLKNALDGGESHCVILFSGEEMRKGLAVSAKELQTSVEYADMQSHAITVSPESIAKLVRVIRKAKPDIIITQDPEHCNSDLDPGRRVAMTLILESIALASRDYPDDSVSDLAAHPIPTIYYHTPVNPDCLIDISSVWDEKSRAMDALKSQLEYSAEHYQTYYGNEVMETVLPGWTTIEDKYEKGKLAKREFDKAYYMFHGATGHAHFAFSEAYRRSHLYHFDNLIV